MKAALRSVSPWFSSVSNRLSKIPVVDASPCVNSGHRDARSTGFMTRSKKALARVDVSLLAVLLIALITALPFLTRSGLPRHTDLELHVFRAAEFERLLAERPLAYPRWAPNFYYGYGYPIFNYYAPLTYYAVGAIALVPVLDIVDAMKIVLVLTFVSAACGVFFFARQHFGGAGGVVAAAAYVLSPYVLFVDPFMRGDAAEFLALGILPWVFLAFDRPLSATRDMACAALALAALVLSHNLMALIGAGLLAAWLAWRGVFVDGVGRWRRDVAAVVLAAGLTAVFWLPFFAERGAVRLDVAGPGHFDFRNHFVELGTLLRPSPVLDLGATVPHFIYNLGFAQWLLALPALLAIVRWRSQPAARIAAFFALASLVLIFLMTPASQALWEAVPPAALIQFPWRFLGPAAFTLAMCAGYTVSAFRRLEIAAAVALSLVLLAALPAMYPPAWDAEFGDTSPRGAVEFELSGVALGTTSTGDFLPHTVAQTPSPAQPLIDAYRAGGNVDRFDYASACFDPSAALRAGFTAPSTLRLRSGHASLRTQFRSACARVHRSPVRNGDLDVEYDVEASGDFTARFFIFAFPGWRAYVDGKPVPLRPSGGDGFILFDVPASARTFGVRFESTSPRMAGAIVTLGSLLVTAALVVASRLRKSPALADPAADPSVQKSPRSAIRLLVLLLAVFLVAKVLIVDRCDTCFRYTSPPGQALAAQHAQRASFGGHVELLGFDLPRGEVEAGQVAPLTLYWRATAPVPANYQVFAHVTRPPFVLWGQSDKLNPGDFPSTRWPLDKYVWDDHALRVLPGTPPGEYPIAVGLYTLGDGRRVPLLDPSGAILGDSVQLSRTLRVRRPSTPPAVETLGMQRQIDARLDGVSLLGASIEQVALPRPNFARLTLFWQAKSDAPPSVTVQAQLIDASGAVASEIVTPPAGGAYPMSLWQAGEIVRDVYAFWLPADFPPGRYTVRVRVEGPLRVAQDIELGQIEVTGP